MIVTVELLIICTDEEQGRRFGGFDIRHYFFDVVVTEIGYR